MMTAVNDMNISDMTTLAISSGLDLEICFIFYVRSDLKKENQWTIPLIMIESANINRWFHISYQWREDKRIHLRQIQQNFLIYDFLLRFIFNLLFQVS